MILTPRAELADRFRQVGLPKRLAEQDVIDVELCAGKARREQDFEIRAPGAGSFGQLLAVDPPGMTMSVNSKSTFAAASSFSNAAAALSASST